MVYDVYNVWLAGLDVDLAEAVELLQRHAVQARTGGRHHAKNSLRQRHGLAWVSTEGIRCGSVHVTP